MPDPLQLQLYAHKATSVVGFEYSTPRGLLATDDEQKVVAALINEKIVPISAHGWCMYPSGLNALENVVVQAQLAGMQTGMARVLKKLCPDKFDEYLKMGEELEKQGVEDEAQQTRNYLSAAPQKIEELFKSVPRILSDAEIDALPATTDPFSDKDTVFSATYTRGFPLYDSKKGVKHARTELKRIEKARRHMLKGMKQHVHAMPFPYLFEQ